MALFQGILFLVLGYGLLGVVYRSLSWGWLPFGRSIRGQLKLYRDEHPFGYWSAFTLYCALGVWVVFMAFALLSGQMEPLPLER